MSPVGAVTLEAPIVRPVGGMLGPSGPAIKTLEAVDLGGWSGEEVRKGKNTVEAG